MTFCTEEPNRPLVGRWNGTEWTRLSPHEEQLAAKQTEIEALTAQLARMKAPVSEERQFFHSILIAEGLSDWSVQSGEAYCYISLKIIKVPEDCVMSLFLHEVAHALYPEPEGEMKNHYHGGNWASTYGNLVNKWMRFDQQLAARAAEPKEAEMASELKPCPFCGGKATFAAAMSDEEGVEILCCNKDCTLLCVSTYATEDEAIAAWNTRTDPQRNRLVKTLKKIRDNPEQHFTYYNRPEEGHSCYFRKGRAKAFQEIAELARDVLEEERRIEAAKKGSHD